MFYSFFLNPFFFFFYFLFFFKIDILNAKLYLFTSHHRSYSYFWQLTYLNMSVDDFLAAYADTRHKQVIYKRARICTFLYNSIVYVSQCVFVCLCCQFNSLEFFSFFIRQIELDGVCDVTNNQQTREYARLLQTENGILRVCTRKNSHSSRGSFFACACASKCYHLNKA